MVLGWSRMAWVSGIFVSVMFCAVMFYINPLIDGKDGFGVIKLQLSFFKHSGTEIVDSWGLGGINRFKSYIFTDYLYAISYVLFFVSIIKMLIEKSALQHYRILIYIAIAAGIFDWIENSMEVAFVSNMENFSDSLFFIHSIISLLKWLALPIICIGIFRLYGGART